ncbi:MAG: InlB B-repeat-containing protein [Gracilibacteraceae bacterium]|nr:InlB B-repeat-containing protein [Gracilibacteraceae bacterium]
MYIRSTKLRKLAALTLAALFALTLLPVGAVTAAEGDPPEIQIVETSASPEFVSGLVPEEYSLTYPAPPRATRGMLTDPSYDARDDYYISLVKNQGANGLCWAFSMYGALEANMLINGYSEQDLSELHMAYATSNSSGNAVQGFTRSPDGGGNRYYSSAYLMRGTNLSGTVGEADDPYITTILGDRALTDSEEKSKNFTVQNILFLSDSKESITSNSIKSAIIEYGAVGASMYWDGTPTADGAGLGGTAYYNSANAAYYLDTPQYNSQSELDENHGVLIVGWDDDYASDNFNLEHQPTDDGAWLVKNSWGDDWGDNGYFWISYEDTNFPLHTFAVDGVDHYDASAFVYEDEYKSNGASWSTSSSTDRWYTEIFTALAADETLDKVKVFIPVANTDVSVYATADFTDETSINTATSSASKHLTYPGWYTFDLDSPVLLGEAGDEFAVTVRIKVSAGSKNGIGISVEFPDNETYYADGSNPSTWWPATYDSDGTTYPANFSIKAVTTSMSDAEAVAAAKAALTWDVIKGDNVEQTAVKTNLSLPAIAGYGTTLSWSSSNAAISVGGVVTRDVLDTQGDFRATISKNSESDHIDFDLTVVGVPLVDTEAVNTAAEDLDWDDIKGNNTEPDDVTEDLTLPTSGTGGATIDWVVPGDMVEKWDSEYDEKEKKPYVSDTGAITRPNFFQNDKTLNLTATLEFGEASVDKDFEITIKSEDQTDKESAYWARDLFTGNETYFWDIINGGNVNKSQIRYNLDAPASGDYGATIHLVTNITAFDNTEWFNQEAGYFYTTGILTRPAYGSSDISGSNKHILVTATKGSITASAYGYGDFTVLAYKGTIQIDTQPVDTNVTVGSISDTLTVTAGTAQGVPGALAYQWYSDTDTTTGGGTKAEGATDAAFTIPTDLTAGTYYYYCEVSALDAAPILSDVAAVIVSEPAAPPAIAVTSSGLDSLKVGQSVSGSIIYTLTDGDYVISIADSAFKGITGLPAGLDVGTVTRTDDKVVMVAINGTPTVANASAVNLTLPTTIPQAQVSGASADITPTGTVSVGAIAKGDGAAVSGVPTVDGTPTQSSITVNAVTNASTSGQTVEYAIDETSGLTPVSGWQDSLTFSGLTAGTTYYVYARTKADANYGAGAAQESAAISTATAPAPDAPVSIAAIAGVTAPAYGATPATAISETAQYTGTVAWSPNDTTFAANTAYTATITLMGKSGYTFEGVAEDFFTVAGASATTKVGSGCYINGIGYFVVGSLQSGSSTDMGQVYYSRVGMFEFDEAGWLVDITGRLVCGVPTVSGGGSGPSNSFTHAELRPIRIDYAVQAGNPAFPLNNIKIGSDGVVSADGADGITYAVDDTGALVAISGTGAATDGFMAIALAQVPNPAGLEMIGNGYYTTSGNSGDPLYYQTGTYNVGSLNAAGIVTAVFPATGPAPGAAVSGPPTVNGAPTQSSITVTAVTAVSGSQTVEYAISQTSSPTPASGWQNSLTFSGLTADTAYYVYARTKADANCKAGAAQASAAITTAPVPVPVTHEVYFVDHDATVLKAEIVTHGAAAAAPADPARAGYSFTGWDQDFSHVTADLTVTAQYSAATHIVYFVDHDAAVLKMEIVTHGAAATAPADPTRAGYAFTGWDQDFSHVTSGLTIRAQYSYNAPVVTGVTVNPALAVVNKGESQQFTATVAGTNNPSQIVIWSVTGGAGGTSISSAGVLTVAANETAAKLTVTATAAADKNVSGTADVLVNAAAAPDRNIVQGTDTFRFLNSASHFFTGSTGAYKITGDYYDYLLTAPGLDNSVYVGGSLSTWKQYLIDSMNSVWGGSCFGMSAVLSLTKAQMLTPGFFQAGASNLYGLDYPRSSAAARNLVNFYQLMQSTPITNRSLAYSDSEPLNLEYVVESMRASAHPVIISFLIYQDAARGILRGGHAVVGYELTETATDYTIKIWDPNYAAAPSNTLTISKDYASGSFTSVYPYTFVRAAHTVEGNDYNYMNIQDYLSGIGGAGLSAASFGEPRLVAAAVGETAILMTNYPSFTISSSGGLSATVKDGRKTGAGGLDISDADARNEIGAEWDLVFRLPALSAGETYTVTPAAADPARYVTAMFSEGNNGFYTRIEAEAAGDFIFGDSGRVSAALSSPALTTVSATLSGSAAKLYTTTVSGVDERIAIEPEAGGGMLVASDSAAVEITTSGDYNSVTFENVDASAGGGGVTVREENQAAVQLLSSTSEVLYTQTIGYRVSFRSMGGTPVEALTNITPGGTVAAPAAPTRTGYTFGGWYTDEAYTASWQFSTPITADLTLFAKWNPKSDGAGGGGGGGGAPVEPVTPVPGAPVTVSKATLTHISGLNRVATSVAISRQGWASAETVILAPGGQNNLIDALAVAPLAGQEKAPILLSTGSLDPAVVAEIQRLGAKKIYAVGAINQNVIDALQAALPGVTVEILKGSNRFETAALINAKLTAPQGTFVVGYNAIADAVSAASFAAANGYAIQIAGPDASVSAVSDVGPVYVLGGPTLVNEVAGATRLYGATRYETNKAIRDALTFEYTNIYTADGNTLVDALTGSALAAQTKAAIVLTPGNDPTGVDFGNITQETKVYAFGG